MRPQRRSKVATNCSVQQQSTKDMMVFGSLTPSLYCASPAEDPSRLERASVGRNDDIVCTSVDVAAAFPPSAASPLQLRPFSTMDIRLHEGAASVQAIQLRVAGGKLNANAEDTPTHDAAPAAAAD